MPRYYFKYKYADGTNKIFSISDITINNRDNFKGLNHAQVFLHYNDKNGKYGEINDGREFLGLPSVNT